MNWKVVRGIFLFFIFFVFSLSQRDHSPFSAMFSLGRKLASRRVISTTRQAYLATDSSKKTVEDFAQELLQSPTSRVPGTFTRLAASLKIKFTPDGLDNSVKSILDRASAQLYYNCADNYDFPRLCEMFGLGDYMSSWYKLTLLHNWMVLLRLHNDFDAKAYIRLQRGLLSTMWLDIDARLKIISDELNQVVTSENDMKHMHGLHLQTFFEYDEGFLSDDRVLAGAIWRCLYMQREADPIHVLRVVTYIRSTVAWLDTLETNQILVEGIKEWKQVAPKSI